MRQQKTHRCIENLLDSVGEGEGGMTWENSIETCILSCETDHQSGFDAWDRVLRAGALGWPWGMGWGGRWEGDSGWGTHVHPWLIHVNVWQKPLQYCKVISLQLKEINFKKTWSKSLWSYIWKQNIKFDTKISATKEIDKLDVFKINIFHVSKDTIYDVKG